MSATAAFFAVRAPVRVCVAQVRPRSPARPSRAPKIGFIDSWLDASRGCSRARKSDRRPPLLVPLNSTPDDQTPKRSTACRAAAKETSVKAEDFKCPLACDASKDEHGAVVEMAKAKCVHPDRPVAKLCGDCPRRK